MANFVLIENNEIIEYHDLLPKSWKNISGLHLVKDDEEFLNSQGWYTVNKIAPVINYENQYIDGYEYKFENNVVTETPIIKEIVFYSPEEKTSEELFQIKLEEVRTIRDALLAACDWTQLADVQQLHDDEWKLSWADYRQQLRDLPNQCVLGMINIYDFIWPTIPNSEL
jgi:hypothetical protein